MLSICVGAAIMIMNLTFVSLINYDTVKTNITCFTESVFIEQMQVFELQITLKISYLGQTEVDRALLGKFECSYEK